MGNREDSLVRPLAAAVMAILPFTILSSCDDGSRPRATKIKTAPAHPRQRTDAEIIRDGHGSPADREAALWRVMKEKRAEAPEFWEEVSAHFAEWSPAALAEYLDCVPVSAKSYVPFMKAFVPYIQSLTDMPRFSACLDPLNEDMRRTFLRSAATGMPVFNPSTLKEFEQMCRTKGEKQDLAEGLDRRFFMMRKDQLVAQAQSFLDAGPSPETASIIIGAALLYRDPPDPRGTADWLLALPAEMSAAGDQSLMHLCAKEHPEVAEAFIRTLKERGQTERADAAARELASAGEAGR